MKLVIFIILFLIAPVHYGTVGVNNVSISVGGNFNYITLGTNLGTDIEKKNNRQEYLGGGFDISLGHLYLSQDTLIHGMDTKLRFTMNFNNHSKIGGEKVQFPISYTSVFNTISFSLGTTYMIGTRVGTGRLMISVGGINIGYLTGTFKTELSSIISNVKTGNSFLIGIELPFGTQYIFDNGFSIGFSHHLDFAFGREMTDAKMTIDGDSSTITPNGSRLGSKESQENFLEYNLAVNVGYVFGK